MPSFSSPFYLQSSLLSQSGFPCHGFTTRHGGVSEGVFASWNFSTSTGDAPEVVEENYQLLAKRLGTTRSMLRSAYQVHSDRVLLLEDKETATADEKADALLSFEPELVVAVKTADCVPLLMADPGSGAVAAIHAGWRGVVNGIAIRTLELLREKHLDAKPLVAIGPHICADCFQVGPEVIEHFPEHHRPDPSTEGRYLVDLASHLQEQLVANGIPSDSIDILHRCTVCDPEKVFFSHRGSQGRCGRLLNFIANRS